MGGGGAASGAQHRMQLSLHPENSSCQAPCLAQVEAERLAAPDLALVQRRIKEVVRVLDDFARLRNPVRGRAEYLDQVGPPPPAPAFPFPFLVVVGVGAAARGAAQCMPVRSCLQQDRVLEAGAGSYWGTSVSFHPTNLAIEPKLTYLHICMAPPHRLAAA
jgi:hypothetical protein